MSGWTWYCEHHESFGMGDSESEVQHMANAHIAFFIKAGNPCQTRLKNHGESSQDNASGKTLSSQSNVTQPSTYMTQVKEKFARAWQKWDKREDNQLIENFNNRMNLEDLTALHQRAAGGIVSRLKKLNLLDEDVDVKQASELLSNRHEKLINRKIYAGELRVVDNVVNRIRIDRGRESLSEYGMVNPPPAPHPDLRHTSMFTCSICNQSVVGNSCFCRGQ
jgi:hypothetical protein